MMGEVLICEREVGNQHDRYAVALKKMVKLSGMSLEICPGRATMEYLRDVGCMVEWLAHEEIHGTMG